jgi:phage shock protein A
MRKANETRNYSFLLGLVEEAQSLANRMEAALGDKADVAHYSQKRHDLRKECKELKAEIDKLKKEKGLITGEEPKVERDWDLG